MTADLAVALADVCADPETWRRRGIAGRSRAAGRFSWPAKVAGATAVYDELATLEASHA